MKLRLLGGSRRSGFTFPSAGNRMLSLPCSSSCRAVSGFLLHYPLRQGELPFPISFLAKGGRDTQLMSTWDLRRHFPGTLFSFYFLILLLLFLFLPGWTGGRGNVDLLLPALCCHLTDQSQVSGPPLLFQAKGPPGCGFSSRHKAEGCSLGLLNVLAAP